LADQIEQGFWFLCHDVSDYADFFPRLFCTASTMWLRQRSASRWSIPSWRPARSTTSWLDTLSRAGRDGRS